MKNFALRNRIWSWLAMGLAAIALTVSPAAASITMSFSPLVTHVAPGSSGDAFDVVLTNSGPNAITIAGFSFELSASSSDISFTSATTGTVTPYIFAGDSFVEENFPFTNVISTTPPPVGQSVVASDYSNSLAGYSLGSGHSVAIGHVFYEVLPTAPSGLVSVNFVDLGLYTSLSDPEGSIIPFTTDTRSGQIVITPEPATIVIWSLLGGLGLVVGWRRFRIGA